MQFPSSLAEDETGVLAVILTGVALMAWYNTGSLALHNRVLTVLLTILLAGITGIAVYRWLN